MVHLPGGVRKRPAEPADAARLPPQQQPVAATNMEEVGEALHKRVKAMQESPLLLQDISCEVLDEPSPLGLRLRKSPSLLELIQKRLSQAKSALENRISEPPQKKENKIGAFITGERMKASNFPADFLKIGTWEYVSQYEGDLVAKCYFAKHKLVWEVLDAGLKSKIEIQWSDISALKATCPENGIGTLDLVLARPPIFFKETDPQPRKHTLWQAASDFTGGQASLNRRHILQCPSSLLSKNFKKLIMCDQRLNNLSQQPDIILDPSVFEPRSSIYENTDESKSCRSCIDLEDEREDPFPKLTHQPMNLAGAADFHVDVVLELMNPNPWSQLNAPPMRSPVPMDGLVNHLGNCITEQNTAVNSPLLEEIAECLLSDTQGPSASDDKYLMARVDSLCSLLEKDAVAASTIPNPEPNDTGIVGIGVSHGFDELSLVPVQETAEETADGIEPPAISRKDSFGELLMNLPHIPSIPQFLFEIPEDFSN